MYDPPDCENVEIVDSVANPAIEILIKELEKAIDLVQLGKTMIDKYHPGGPLAGYSNMVDFLQKHRQVKNVK